MHTAGLCHNICDNTNVQKTWKSCFAGGRLTRRFRPEGQPASRHHQWQDSGDVSISGSEAGPAGPALPDDDPSIYTCRSTRFAPQLPQCLRHVPMLETNVLAARQRMLQVACLVERRGSGEGDLAALSGSTSLLVVWCCVVLMLRVKVTAEHLDVICAHCSAVKLPLSCTAVC